MKKALVKITNKTSSEDTPIQVITPGKFYSNSGEYKIEYDETKLSGMEGTTTLLTVNEDKFTLSRSGNVQTIMEFQKGQRTIAVYDTPYGNLNIFIDTKKMESDISENGGTINLVYTLNLDNQEKIINNLDIEVKVKDSRGRIVNKKPE